MKTRPRGRDGSEPRPGRRPCPLVCGLLIVGLALATLAGCDRQQAGTPQPALHSAPGSATHRLLGAPPSGGAWFSGVWPGGGTISGSRAEQFGAWRGTPVDAGITYPAWQTWDQISSSTWHVATYDGFRGILVYGLPMLPSQESSSLLEVTQGRHDAVYRKVAADLVAHGRGRSVVRIGWEANGSWFPWRVTAGDATAYVAAYRHIAGVLRATAPDLVLDFDVACGTPLPGQPDRLDALLELYPGDDVVDLVGCDSYDWYTTTTKDEASWLEAKRPAGSVGLADVADFARAHGLGMSVPEWGLASQAEGGSGDNPYFIDRMRAFFEANSDVLVLECYFNEPDQAIRNSIFDPDDNVRASEEYARLW